MTLHRRHLAIAQYLVIAVCSALLLRPFPAFAHVKWFAPYVVGAPPQPVSPTLATSPFWIAVALVLGAFIATRVIERTRTGQAVLNGLDRMFRLLWRDADRFMRAVTAGFFVAVFAVGGVYLTPDLTTPSEAVSWAQLLIAACIAWRRTRPIAAMGILGLWTVALRDYDLFHLLDYLALGVAVAGYLVLESVAPERWRRHRFEVLRWGVAIALMWSSLEKFAYPDWFVPLVEERPFLTLGLPRDVFVPMAGVAEFTLGFGLLWTPLVRRLSAIALLIVFNLAIYPFGRIDFVGHALIMAVIVLIAADPERQIHFAPMVKRRLAGVPVGFAAAFGIFVASYWSLHLALYGRGGVVGSPTSERATHSRSPDHPHGPHGPSGIGAPPDRRPGTPLGNTPSP